MYWLASCPLCGVDHEIAADLQPPPDKCWHPIPLPGERFRMPGTLNWVPSGEKPYEDFKVRHPSPDLAQWPLSSQGGCCELDGCDEPRLVGVPLCKAHAALAPFALVRDVMVALEQTAAPAAMGQGLSYPRAEAALMRHVTEARELIEG